MKHIKGLDVLRAFAVLLVIIAHWGPHKVGSPALTFFFTKIVPEGMFGVDLFFVLSGYLITNILIKARNDSRPGERLQIIKSFYIRRMLRIFPIYFLVIFFVAYVMGDQFVKNNIWYYVTYTSNFLCFKVNGWVGLGHTWSLAVEEQFYIIWPWIIIYSPKKYLFHIIISSVLIGVASTLLLNYEFGQFSEILLLPCITAFAIGALYAFVVNNDQHKKLVLRFFLLLLPISIVLLFVHQLGGKLILIRLFSAIIGINAIVYICNQKYNSLTRLILDNRFLINVGKVSYGIYLYHYVLPGYLLKLVNYINEKVHLSEKTIRILTVPPWAYLIQLVLLALVSILSYRLIELNFLKLKRYFAYVPDKRSHISAITVE